MDNLQVFLNYPPDLPLLSFYRSDTDSTNLPKPPDNPVDNSLMVTPASRSTTSVLYNVISNFQCSSVAAVQSKWNKS